MSDALEGPRKEPGCVDSETATPAPRGKLPRLRSGGDERSDALHTLRTEERQRVTNRGIEFLVPYGRVLELEAAERAAHRWKRLAKKWWRFGLPNGDDRRENVQRIEEKKT